jgi:ABC-2 type transport system permease protein
MNTQTADLLATGTVPRVHGGTRETLRTLMQREFWEHPALWRAPAIVAGLLAVATVFAVARGIHIDGGNIPGLLDARRVMVLNVSQDVWLMVIYLVASIVVSFYALDCLFAERKDRSILFWKSLPVSDGLTVLSKFLVASVAVPLLVFGLALVSHLIAFFIWKLRVATGGVPDVVAWDTVAWVRGEIFLALLLTLSSLWYAPVIAAMMLVSAWVKRAPIMWATLPLVLLPIFEYIVFRTGYILAFLHYRTQGIWQVLLSRNGEPININEDSRLLSDLNWLGAFASPGLWLGVAAAAALLYAAARVRRYRDDT